MAQKKNIPVVRPDAAARRDMQLLTRATRDFNQRLRGDSPNCTGALISYGLIMRLGTRYMENRYAMRPSRTSSSIPKKLIGMATRYAAKCWRR